MTRSGAGSQPIPFPRRPRSAKSDALFHRAQTLLPPNNLPTNPTSFIGRYAEVAAVSSLILDESVRLLTLTGPGGMGKTRLAFRVAEDLLPHFEDGVYFVPLASLNDPQLVVPTIAQTLGIKEDGATPLTERLGDHLRDKGMLLLLDNFEQVAEAAPQLTALIQDAPGVQVIITSRVSMHLYGEHEYPVPPMLLPDLPDAAGAHYTAEQLGAYEAIQLFVDRAQLVRPDFSLTSDNAQPIAQICTRLDGLPLAIELASSRTRLFSPQALLARLDKSLPLLTGGSLDLPARQQTLRQAIDWSYNLLDSIEQRLFARMGVFAGGCTLDAAAHIARDMGLAEGDLLDSLESLIDKNLLRQREEPDGEPRFWMLATIREYAVEKLAESGEMATVREAHARFFLSMAERFAEELRGPKQADWLALLEREHDNLRAALSWTTDTHIDAEAGVNMVGALWWFWYVRGHISEGRRWLEKALALAGADSPQLPESLRRKLADAYNGAGSLAGTQGDYAQATAMLRQSLAITRSLGNTRGVARTLNNLGIFVSHQGAYAEAERYFRESFDLKKEIQDEVGLSSAYNRLAEIAHVRGEYNRAEELYGESLALRRALGDKAWIVDTVQNLAGLAYDTGDLARALRLAIESRDLAEEMGYKEGLANSLSYMAMALFEQGRHETAESLLKESLDLSQAMGDQSTQSLTLTRLAQVASSHQEYVQARALLKQALQIRVNLREYNAEMASALEWLAYLDIGEEAASDVRERVERAATIFGATEARREEMGAPITPINRAHHTEMAQRARARLGPSASDAAWGRGRAMTFEEVATFALREAPASTQAILPASQTAPGDSGSSELTTRELDVLRLVAEGLTNKEIAERLVLSHRTVQNHLYSIFSKLDVTTRSAATRHALQHNLVPNL